MKLLDIDAFLPVEQMAIRAYKTNAYENDNLCEYDNEFAKRLNIKLSNKDPLEGFYKTICDALDNSFNNPQAQPSNQTVYRACSPKSLEFKGGEIEGQEVVCHAFMSTSENKERIQSFADENGDDEQYILVIHLNCAKPVLPFEYSKSSQDEKEVLIPRGSKFTINTIDTFDKNDPAAHEWLKKERQGRHNVTVMELTLLP